MGDEGLELRLGDVGECEVQHFVSLRRYCGEVSVEEDCVEDAWLCSALSALIVICVCIWAA